MDKNNSAPIKYISGIFFLLFACFLAGCRASIETPTQTSEAQILQTQPSITSRAADTHEPVTNTPEVFTPEPVDIQLAWQSSPHANSYVLDADGQNNSCARCHSPINWMPTLADLPESCFACKFELEAPPPTISKVDWTNIPCKICHKVDKKQVVQAEYAWLSIAPLDEYAEVASATELCMKCHATEGIAGHGTVQLLAAHAGYECTRCHPAHETITSCDIEGCHPTLDNATTPIPGHDQDHQSVSCVACHDGAGMQVGLDEKTGFWTTLISDTLSGSSEKVPFTSHNVVLEVRCDRCHFAGNPWGLSETVAEP